MPRALRPDWIRIAIIASVAMLSAVETARSQIFATDLTAQATGPSNPAALAPNGANAPTPQPPVSQLQPPTPPAAAPAPNQLAQAETGAMPNTNPAGAQQFLFADAPYMIGDLRNGPHFTFIGEDAKGLPVRLLDGSLSLAAGDPGGKISEDCSPLPVDRVFFDFNGFNQAAVTADGHIINVNRYTFGIEKTFLDGEGSIEFRAPLVSGLAPNQSDISPTELNQGTVLGDMSVTTKFLITKTDTWASSVGLMVNCPTAPNVSAVEGAATTDVRDESFFLAPFVGLLIAPNSRLFSISYLQFDFDANGSTVLTQMPGVPPTFDGKLRFPTLMHIDVSVGYWVYDVRDEAERDWALGGYLSGVAPVVELHYTTTLQPYPQDVLPSLYAGEDVLDLTAGFDFQLGPMSSLVVAGCVPLRSSLRDREFDSELIVELDRRF